MAREVTEPGVRASEIARFLGRPLQGPDVVVHGPSAASTPESGTLVFINSESGSLIEAVNRVGGLVALVPLLHGPKLSVSCIEVKNPRLAFAQTVGAFFTREETPSIASSAMVAGTASLGPDVSIGEYSVVGDGVAIGEGTSIGNHVSIAGQAQIGKYCSIKSHAVIGETGFAYEYDELNHPVRLPHLGSVAMGDHVEIGSFTTVVRGTIGSTTIHDWVKVDDHVHIAHNVIIGEGALVIANAEVSGSVEVGAGAWIAPSASTMNGIKIGAGAQVGLGAVVLADVAPDTVVVGNPARVLRPRDP